jgi:multidrug efflux pump subunit AcrB
MAFFRFFVKQPVFVNLLFVLAIVAGVVTYADIPVDLNPDVSFETAGVITVYQGASPEEVEDLITIPIEDQVKELDGISRVISISGESRSTVLVEYESGMEDFKGAVRDLRDAVDNVDDLPQEAENPLVFEFGTSSTYPVISVVLSSEEMPEPKMKDLVEDIQDELKEVDGVSSVNVAGVRDREIWVEVDPQNLHGYGLAIRNVVDALRMANLDLSGGKIKTSRREYLVRTLGEFKDIGDIEEVVIKSSPVGQHILVRDIAQVRDTFEEEQTLSRLNGQRAVSLSILREKGGNNFEIVHETKSIVEEQIRRSPFTIKIAYINDSTILISRVIQRIKNNALYGLGLVVLTLYLFVGFRNAVFAAVGIPFSFLCTFVLMHVADITINTISLFSLILVLGIVVDDAIVMIENIYRHIEKGSVPVEAAVTGASQVAMPVLASVLTTVAAFLPLLLMVGIIGNFLAVIPLVVSFALLSSLFEAFIILPSHVADFGGRGREPVIGERPFRFMKRIYRRVVVRVLRFRYLFLLIILFLACCGAYLAFFVLERDLFAEEEISQFSCRVHIPVGSRLEETDKIISRIEKLAMELPQSEVTAVLSRTGIIIGDYMVERGTHVGEVMVDLVEEEERSRMSDEIIDELRSQVERISGITSVEFAKVNTGPPVGEPVAIQVRGEEYTVLEAAADEIMTFLARIGGVRDIHDDLERGKGEIRIRISEEKAALYGLTNNQIALAVKGAFEGLEATTFRAGGEEVDVIVKFQEADRRGMADFERIKLQNPQGDLIPFYSIADVAMEKGYAHIIRRDFERAIMVNADVDPEVIKSTTVNKIVEGEIPMLEARYPGIEIKLGGEYEKTQESFASLTRSFLVAIAVIYMILGTQFQSFAQPLVIMLTVPFSFIGVVLGLLVMGYPFSLVAFVGLVALSGVVVNDSLVLVDFINKRRRQSLNRWRAIIQSGKIRMRPILLTTITTVLGLLPMGLGMGGKSRVWGPMANTIIWGLGFATILTLFFIPAFYAIMDDLVGWVFKGNRVERQRVPRDRRSAS